MEIELSKLKYQMGLIEGAEVDGWDAWIELKEWIAKLEAAQPRVQRTLFPACANCEYNPCDLENNWDYCPAPERR